LSTGWTIFGSIAQLMLAYMLFMLAVFAGGGMANGRKLAKRQIRYLDRAMVALPGSAVLSVVIVLYHYYDGSGPWAFMWYALPVLPVIAYLTFLKKLSSRSKNKYAMTANEDRHDEG
jgi:hypothetical protein